MLKKYMKETLAEYLVLLFLCMCILLFLWIVLL